MNKRLEIVLFIILFCLFGPLTVYCIDYNVDTDARSFILKKLKTHHIVFLGTTHKKPAMLKFLSELIPELHDAGVTHIGMEIAFTQQGKIDHFLQTGNKLSKIRIHPKIDSPEYRNLLLALAGIDSSIRPKPIALDLPKSQHRGRISRNKWMAGTIMKVFENNPKAKMFVVLGNYHVLKVLNWKDNVTKKPQSIYGYLKNIIPQFRIFTIFQLVDENPQQCDFTEVFASIPGLAVFDCDGRFDGWKFGPTSNIAIKPTKTCDLVDGIIVY
jgi:hypothetical protein